MVMLPGNNPLDVEVRAEERAAERERQMRGGDRAEGDRAQPVDGVASQPWAGGRASIAERMRRWLHLR